MKRLPKEDKAGLYITVIVHLAVMIILLATQLTFTIKKENSFIMDFSQLEELEKLQKELSFKEDINRKLEEMIEASGVDPVRNVTVDRGALKDDRGTNADELYKEAERLQKELQGGFNADDEVESPASHKAPEKQEKPQEKREYSGPSVLSWELDSRKASKLPIPAYRCMGAGEVKIIIGVNNAGDVISAVVKDDESSSDPCLRNYGIRAARLSKFSTDSKAPAKQMGYIIYKFIAQ